jgi:hypothetical protein
MTLRELAAAETTVLVDRLIAAMTAELEAATTRLQSEHGAALDTLRLELTESVAAAEAAARRGDEAERARAAEIQRVAALQRDLDEARRALEAARAEADTRAARLQADAKATVDTLTATAARQQADARAQIDALTDAATRLQEDAREKIDALTASAAKEQAEARARIDAVTAAAARAQAEAGEKLQAAHAAAARQQAQMQEQLDAALARTTGIDAEARAKIDALTKASARQQADLQEKLDAAMATAAGIDAEAKAKIDALGKAGSRQQAETQAKIEALARERDQLAGSLKDAKKKLDAAAAERDTAAAALQRSEAARGEQARTMREQVLQLASLPMDRLRAGFYRLTTAPSVAEALTALVETLGSEFSRAALFQVTGNRLQGVHQVGFDFDSDISKVVVPLTRESPLTEAVRSGRVQGLTASELTASSRTLFGGSPGFVLVLPVAICGEIGAVIYADDSEDPEAEYSTPERRVKFAEVLLWHAVPLLARLAIEENTRAELREYAIQLFTDLERAYAADTTTAPNGEKLRGHLSHNLEYARQMFAQHADGCGRPGSGLFDEQLEALIRSQGTTPFVRDLAAVAHLTAVRPAKSRKQS